MLPHTDKVIYSISNLGYFQVIRVKDETEIFHCFHVISDVPWRNLVTFEIAIFFTVCNDSFWNLLNAFLK